MRKVLEEEGHIADVAYDGEDGLAMAMEGSHDVIVLDSLLPGIDGSEVCRALTVPRPVLHSGRRTRKSPATACWGLPVRLAAASVDQSVTSRLVNIRALALMQAAP